MPSPHWNLIARIWFGREWSCSRDECNRTANELEELQVEEQKKSNLKHAFPLSLHEKLIHATWEKHSSRRGFACPEAIQRRSTSPMTIDSVSFCKEKIRRFCTV